MNHKMRWSSLLASVGVLAGVLATPSAAEPADTSAQQQVQLVQVRAVTAQYHYEPLAVRDGYQLTEECVPGMGLHYANPSLIDRKLDIREPEVILYAPGERGMRQLVAVEYLYVDEDQNTATDADRPSLFGVPFVGPMEGHVEGMPVHYELHAWVWLDNPNGVFAQENPKMRC